MRRYCSVKPNLRYAYVLLSCLICLFFIPVPAFADNQTSTPPTVKDLFKSGDSKDKVVPHQSTKMAFDRLNRETPRSSIIALNEAVKDGDFERGLEFMDMRQVPAHIAHQGPELVRKLRIIAARTFWMGPENLSPKPEGHRDDGLPSYLDRVATIKTPDGPVDILLQRVPGDHKGEFIWKISNRTVAEIPRLYELYGYGELGDKLSTLLPEFDGFFLQPWQLVILLGLVLIAFTIAWLLTRMVILFLKRSTSPRSERIQAVLAGPIRFLIMVIIFRNYFHLSSPSLKLQALFEAKTLYIAAFAWLLMGVVNLSIGRLIDRMQESGHTNGALILNPASRAIKGTIILVAIMVWLDNMGFKISTLLAGLGVGSIAVALAAQKSIENLIGAITLYTAQPIRVGDFCRFANMLGTVEEIGLRSTKVRTLANTLIFVPNANLSNMEIENISQRQKILYRHKIRLRPDSTHAQIETVLNGIRQLLISHPDVDPVPGRVRFKDFGEYSLDLEVFTYIKTTDYNEYLAIAEGLNLRIMEIIAQAGTRIAVPTHSLQIEKGHLPDIGWEQENQAEK